MRPGRRSAPLPSALPSLRSPAVVAETRRGPASSSSTASPRSTAPSRRWCAPSAATCACWHPICVAAATPASHATGYGLLTHARDVVRLLDAHDVDHAVLGGHSMGAFV